VAAARRSTTSVLVAPTMMTWYPEVLDGDCGPGGGGGGGGGRTGRAGVAVTTPAVDLEFGVCPPRGLGLSQQQAVVLAVQL
jgi:hypothetical protein